jgi:hypothetical protein
MPAPVSDLIPTSPPDPTEIERVRYEEFARGHAAEQYRARIDRMYDVWQGFNRAHFGGRLTPPHVSIGRTAPRRFSQCRLTTNYGGRIDLTLSEAVVFAANRTVVRREFPAAGYVRFEDDLLLAETVKQFVLEVEGHTEEGYGGYGPRFAAHATRIGEALGLPAVPARRRGSRGAGLPVAAFWPWAFRPEGYYLGDVRLDGRRVAGLRPRPAGAVNSGTVNEYLLYLLVTGKTDRLRLLLERQVDADREARHPAVAAAERTPLDRDGRPKAIPVLNPEWVTWHDRCPARMAEYVAARRAFEVLPILADALEDAGCDDPDVLDHCRRPALHTMNCWVLRAIRAAVADDPERTEEGP